MMRARTSRSLVFSLGSESRGCGAIVEIGAGTAKSRSRKGFRETGRLFIEGLGSAVLESAGLGGPFRFLKGLLERRDEGRRSGSVKQGCQSVHQQ